MLIDTLKELLSDAVKKGLSSEDSGVKSPDEVGVTTSDKNVADPKQTMDKPPSDTIYNDNGSFSLDQTPFSGLKDMISKSRDGNNTGPSVLRQLLGSLLPSKVIPDTGTVASAEDNTKPATLNPNPLAKQRQPSFAETTSTPTPLPRPDYSQPTALDPNAIEQLRLSLLTDAGQLDPNNPNGLAGRMTGPNSKVDMNNQRQEAMSIEDSVRGFDGVKRAKMQKGNM